MPSASQRTALAPTDREAIFAKRSRQCAAFGMGHKRGDQRHRDFRQAGEGRVKNAI